MLHHLVEEGNLERNPPIFQSYFGLYPEILLSADMSFRVGVALMQLWAVFMT